MCHLPTVNNQWLWHITVCHGNLTQLLWELKYFQLDFVGLGWIWQVTINDSCYNNIASVLATTLSGLLNYLKGTLSNIKYFDCHFTYFKVILLSWNSILGLGRNFGTETLELFIIVLVQSLSPSSWCSLCQLSVPIATGVPSRTKTNVKTLARGLDMQIWL